MKLIKRIIETTFLLMEDGLLNSPIKALDKLIEVGENQIFRGVNETAKFSRRQGNDIVIFYSSSHEIPLLMLRLSLKIEEFIYKYVTLNSNGGGCGGCGGE